MPATATPALAMLRLRGAEAGKFLQGQLSNDMGELSAQRLLPAGLHTPQGRVSALLWLCAPAADEIVALLPDSVAALAAAALRRVVLRARVSIEVLAPDPGLSALPGAPAATREAKALAISAGIPQVYAATSGLFIAQMLNLDCIGAISFRKGCYTGQEVIARTHYRGRVKRRLQRFATPLDLGALEAGATLGLPDGRSAQLVDASALPAGGCEFLAVTTFADAAGAPDEPHASDPATFQLTHCTPLPLPYAWPA